jgi:hypothetical protein
VVGAMDGQDSVSSVWRDTVLLVGRSLQLMLPARRTAAHQTVAVASSGGRAVLGAAVDGDPAAETYLVRRCCRSSRTLAGRPAVICPPQPAGQRALTCVSNTRIRWPGMASPPASELH